MFSNIVVKLIYQYSGLHFLWISWIHLKLAFLMRYNSQSLFIVHRGKSTKLHPNEPWKIGEFTWFHAIVIVCQSDKTQISQLIILLYCILSWDTRKPLCSWTFPFFNLPSWFFICIWTEFMWALDAYSLLTAFLARTISLARILQDSFSPFLAASLRDLFTFSSSLWIPTNSRFYINAILHKLNRKIQEKLVYNTWHWL